METRSVTSRTIKSSEILEWMNHRKISGKITKEWFKFIENSHI